jgi:hypothetical protein
MLAWAQRLLVQMYRGSCLLVCVVGMHQSLSTERGKQYQQQLASQRNRHLTQNREFC